MQYKAIVDYLKEKENKEVIKAIISFESGIENDEVIEKLYDKFMSAKHLTSLLNDDLAYDVIDYYERL